MKNPFTPQVSSAPVVPGVDVPVGATIPGADLPATGTTATATSPSAHPTPLDILTGGPAGASPTTTPVPPAAGATPASTTPTPSPASTVAISVNGTVSRVGTRGTFPAGAPVFKLASWQHGSAEIGIVGGSYAIGGQTLTLTLNQPVTLQNTHDGKQYKLVLVSTP